MIFRFCFQVMKYIFFVILITIRNITNIICNVFVLLADSEAVEVLWQVRAQRRQAEPDLPDTVTRLTTPEGSIVYLVGTAHFSDSSKKDVATVRIFFLYRFIYIFVSNTLCNYYQLNDCSIRCLMFLFNAMCLRRFERSSLMWWW